ncbi:hypothetical protein [Streptomyces liangshanensis]|uniref:hypothetical protein n=1 Tax=Streptomyces liangshanensis TaxID=2717324 RepID=UPI0036DB33E0
MQLYGISDLMSMSVIPSRYKVPAALHEPITLTSYGEGVCRRLMRVRNFKWPEARLACLLSFYHEELLVDHLKTDIDALVSALNEEIQSGRVLHPFIWGRELYDKAFTLFAREPRSLDHTESMRLLQDTPRGVFQQIDLVTGPLGILRSREMRDAPSTVKAPLYHCAKRSCNIVHGAVLMTSDSQVAKTQEKLEEIFEKEYGVASDFYEFISEVQMGLCNYYGDQRSISEIPLLGECFSGDELDAILLEALKGKSAPLREVLSANKIAVTDPREWIAGLDKAGKMQALLLMDSRSLAAAIDGAVYSGGIDIPPHEVREPKIMRFPSGHYRLVSECSRYGVRTIPVDATLAMVRLRRLILSIYSLSDETATRELGWRLRKTPGSSVEEKLERYLGKEEPAEIIRNLVLVGPGPFSIAAEKCGVVQDRVERMEDEELLNVLLWKLGFDPINSDDTSGSLQKHREVFAQMVANFTGFSEAEKYEIKRESTLVFTALEKTLDATLSFATWALTFDHRSAHPKYNYYLSDARSHMAELFNGVPAKSGDRVIYDSQGRNTLAPLISGFSRLRECLSRIQSDADSYLRPVQDMPTYAGLAELTFFPYLHTIPFLDLSLEAQENITEVLRRFTKTLEEGGVSSVRNSLQHQREEFPSQEELLRCIRAIGSFLDEAEKSGLCPTLFQSNGNSRDSAGRTFFSYKDYKGREYVARRPSGIGEAGMPPLLQDQLIIPVAAIRQSTDVLRFSVGARSAYTDLWLDWPKYRASSESPRELLDSIDSSAG